MLSAAAAWNGLAEHLSATASSFAAVTSGLANEAWQGATAQAMTHAADPYVGWLNTAARQAEQAAGQARLVVDAFDAVRAAVVHPALIAANKNQVVALVRSNLFGQNTPAIAAAEAEYEQMWAQDVAAMLGYHASASAAVAQLPPFQEGLQQLLRNVREQAAHAYAAAGLPPISVDLQTGTFNVGNGNIGVNNIGNGNVGNGNIGNGNVGNGNIGFLNTGDRNIGFGNIGNWNIGANITGNGQIGLGKTGGDGPPFLVVGDGGPGVTALVVGGTDSFVPVKVALLEYAAHFISPFHPGYTAQVLETPSKFFPFTGLDTLTFDASVAQGVANLHAAIMAQHALGNEVVVFGVSQGAMIAAQEMRYLQSIPEILRPGIDELSFALTGNPGRPDGGIFARFGSFAIPEIGLSFTGATPSSIYPAFDYSTQYDGVSDFPRYPLNIFSTANALAGILFLHSGLIPTPPGISSGVIQPVSSSDVLTTYILIPTHDLPLLYPLRAIPLIGDPLADLIQPNLRILVELGYDRTAYQDIPQPFGLFPSVDWGALAVQLQEGAAQGVNDALSGLRAQIG
ncbi:putative PPE family protein PPE42 [Mycobacterium bourgelatii]|uniref:Putative PPE family protein PPE42 n=2 Tax=Mycobacterium bourgelatii TaxID=1273442 RepID=A0A7I9YMU2_MYCBU|nr:putative PPE family protein PPE42 [Mycobacterium bourgelatii]